MSTNHTLNIAFSNFPFVNCFGSYVASAYKYFFPAADPVNLLLYLADCELRYTQLNVQQLMEKYNNPWRFQPLRIYDPNDTPLFSKDTFLSFLSFLEHQYSIYAEIVPHNSPPQLILEKVMEAITNSGVVLLSVDEYYLVSSKRFYYKHHNFHGLILKGFDLSEKYFEVVDSEVYKPYMIPFAQLLDSLHHSIYKKDHYILNHYNDLHRNEKLLTINVDLGWLKHRLSFPIMLFINDLPSYFEANDIDYVLRGLNFTINFQLLPFLLFRINVLSKLNIPSFLKADLDSSIKMWRNISLRLRKRVLTQNADFQHLQPFFQKILELENKIADDIDTLGLSSGGK